MYKHSNVAHRAPTQCPACCTAAIERTTLDMSQVVCIACMRKGLRTVSASADREVISDIFGGVSFVQALLPFDFRRKRPLKPCRTLDDMRFKLLSAC